MSKNFIDTFRLLKEREDFDVVRSNIEKDAVFFGANLWVLFFAILIASLGLNINSTPVVIGAMLISPLMGPILGVGTGLATNDIKLVRKAFLNYAFAAGVGLASSTIYFLVSPIDDAHAEILSRTLPTVYDVLIALFGGFAGIIATSTKHKGNVIPGVAIATALMPPLCTAGYGLATWQLHYFLGAFYLYIINSVFISVATFTTAYLLKFPIRRYEDPKVERRERVVIWTVIMITLLPSIYLGYDIVGQKKFIKRADQFIDSESALPNDYLLSRNVDAKKKIITLTYGGQKISDVQIEALKLKLKYYELTDASLEIKQGFSFLSEPKDIIKDNKNSEQLEQLGLALQQTEIRRAFLESKLDSVNRQDSLSTQIFSELKIQYPQLTEAILQPATLTTDSLRRHSTYLVLLHMPTPISKSERDKVENWLKVRLKIDQITVIIETSSSSLLQK